MARKVKIPLSTKFALTFVPLILLVMLMTIYAVHRTVTMQFTERYQNDLQMAVKEIERELINRQEAIELQLRQLVLRIQEDYEFRLQASVLNNLNHPYIVDYAPMYMATMGLQALEIIDEYGVVLSLGQYRSAFGGNAAGLVRNIVESDTGITFVRFDHPDGYILCLSAMETFRVGNRTYYVVGGIEVNELFLRGLQAHARNIVLLRTPDHFLSSDPGRVEPAVLTEFDLTEEASDPPEALQEEYSFSHLMASVAGRDTTANGGIYLLHSRKEHLQLLQTLNEKIAAITIVGIIFVIILAFWQAGNIARPLRRLANKASDISLDSLDDIFVVKSNDEVGILNDALKTMVQRLRKSRLDLAIAEQKAAFAEIARKVNHDIKNGFIPIRNVMQHWSEVADSNPEELVSIFKERRETVNESIHYLQDLAQNYARSSSKMEIKPVNVHELIDTVVRNYRDLPGKHIRIESNYAVDALFVQAENHKLRRAIENVVCNAVDACGNEGSVMITTEKSDDSIVILIEDTGDGIPPEIRDQLFHTHVTTKTDGTGIGLLSAQSIIKEYNGTISLEERKEGGTRVRIRLPVLHPESIKQIEPIKEGPFV